MAKAKSAETAVPEQAAPPKEVRVFFTKKQLEECNDNARNHRWRSLAGETMERLPEDGKFFVLETGKSGHGPEVLRVKIQTNPEGGFGWLDCESLNFNTLSKE